MEDSSNKIFPKQTESTPSLKTAIEVKVSSSLLSLSKKVTERNAESKRRLLEFLKDFSRLDATQSGSIEDDTKPGCSSTVQNTSHSELLMEIQKNTPLNMRLKADYNGKSQTTSEYAPSSYYWGKDFKSVKLPIGVANIYTYSSYKGQSFGNVHTCAAHLSRHPVGKFFVIGGGDGDLTQHAFKDKEYAVKFATKKGFEIPPGYFYFDLNPPEQKRSGPSADLSMVIACLSRILDMLPASDIAYSAEIDESGGLIAIGGLPERMAAVKALGKTKMLLAKDNEKDYKELDKKLTEGVTFVFAANFEELFEKHIFPQLREK
ncbi:Lon proteolytic domain-containing protein [Meloidogyne graminicola]|uniref:Lon proteolytic domain-containing protein n=1 Tax=Meloidogyne graminicola TaxID=189291 RepID=A0A8S9ZDR5_9BILA|nr:Lon proteolytic domain-containing protein [Meloidogyne graminicola]